MKAKITAKILIALCCIINVMPFSYTEVNADNNQSLTVNITMSDSDVTFRDDPEDSRYQIGTLYVSFNSSVACAGLAHLYFGTDNTRVNVYQNVALPYAFSPNGVTVSAAINEYYYDEHPPDVFGYDVTVAWQNLDQWILCFEYKVIKSVNTSSDGPIKLTFSGIDIDPGDLLPSYPGMINAELELLNQNIELLVLNENLSDQEIESMLGGIAGNTYNIQETLYDIYMNDINPTANLTYNMGYYKSLSAGSTLYTAAGMVNNNGKVWVDLNTNSTQTVSMIPNRFYRIMLNYGNQSGDIDDVNNVHVNGFRWFNTVNGTYSDLIEAKYYIQHNTTYTYIYVWDLLVPRSTNTVCVVELEGSNNLFKGTASSQIAWWSMTQKDYYDMMYKFNVLNGIERIIGAIGNITVEQTINIDNTYNELNTYNTQINTITNNYNTQFTDLNQQLEFDDLVDVDPESENNILNSVNFYNSVFNEFIEVPHVKEILIFILLCILIIGLVG